MLVQTNILGDTNQSKILKKFKAVKKINGSIIKIPYKMNKRGNLSKETDVIMREAEVIGLKNKIKNKK